ncbi:hypothetical protein [Pseudosporangium ferrugineum]|uniref:hypothetical protein n=1 Tax=Pseudosporangium ferrugineum TaxID=439699 RepID=UPI0011B24D50|nr:hypothetical protein [Pseudosporangium ferrugineum]
MDISVRVVEYTGQIVAGGSRNALGVSRAASEDPAAYPLLAGVDELDDTIFNWRQSVVLIDELHRLAAATQDPEVRAAAADIISLAELLAPAPQRPHHRRLIFIGD